MRRSPNAPKHSRIHAARKREWFPASDFYTIAAKALRDAKSDDTQIREKLDQMTIATVGEKVSHPLHDEVTPEPSDWDHGWDQAESLALAGRFADADALLIRLESVRDDHPFRGCRPGNCSRSNPIGTGGRNQFVRNRCIATISAFVSRARRRGYSRSTTSTAACTFRLRTTAADQCRRQEGLVAPAGWETLVVYYNVPGEGPEWTLTLIDIVPG